MPSRSHLNPPAADEIEISVFGPGFGECIVIHATEGRWFIIDSCVDSRSRPASLSYLSEISVSYSNVEMVVATHWHDDHVAGLDQVMEECPSAQFWCSDALSSAEFLQLLEIQPKRKDFKFTRGVQYIGRLVDTIGSRFNFALAGMRVYQNSLGLPAQTRNIEVWALSPSQRENVIAKLNLEQIIQEQVGAPSRIVARNPNHASLTLALLIGDVHVLLGADLEEPGSPDLGWSAVLSNTTLPTNFRADLFKIPHHGSATAHHPNVWTNLTTGKPVTATTPWRVAGSVLPRRDDVDRIVDLSRSSYVTKESLYQPAVRRTNMVRKLTPTSLRRIQRTPGQIRFRKSLGQRTSDWQVELFDGAAELTKFRT